MPLGAVDSSKVLEFFRNRREKFNEDMTNAMRRSGREFIGYIQQKEYSGRPGLEVQSDALRGGWQETTSGSGGDIATTITPGSTSKRYARAHDKSRTFDGWIRPKVKEYLCFKVHASTRIFSKAGKRLKRSVREFSWVKVKQVFLPVRTDVVGDFAGRGREIFTANINTALGRWANGGT